MKHFGDKEWRQVGIELQNSLLSQFMHGEQGALLCTARIVETVPWIDAKYYAATQVMDEARHVEVFARYLDEKLGTQYGINENLKGILDDILSDPRWDIAYLGMQIMVEGLALAAFGMMHTDHDRAAAEEDAALRDERRGAARRVRRALVAGVLQASSPTRRCASARSSRSTSRGGCSVASRTPRCGRGWGSTPTPCTARWTQVNPPAQQMFQQLLFSKIVPNCKKLGLLDAADGWLRERFTEIGVIQFEDWVDTGEEYAALDEVEKDRQESAS